MWSAMVFRRVMDSRFWGFFAAAVIGALAGSLVSVGYATCQVSTPGVWPPTADYPLSNRHYDLVCLVISTPVYLSVVVIVAVAILIFLEILMIGHERWNRRRAVSGDVSLKGRDMKRNVSPSQDGQRGRLTGEGRSGPQRSLLAFSEILAPFFVAFALTFYFLGVEVDAPTGLAIYGAEIQIFVIFATLAPLFFAILQFYGKRSGQKNLAQVGGFVMFAILASLVGILFCILSMMSHLFNGTILLFPLALVAEVGTLVMLSMLGLSGNKTVRSFLSRLPGS
jgi:hypothetical protein